MVKGKPDTMKGKQKMIKHQWVPDDKVICSLTIKKYRLILYRDSLGFGYQLLDDGKNVQHYSAPDNRSKAIGMMGVMMIEALADYGVTVISD